MEEIFVVELFYKNSKQHSFAYFKSLEGARKFAIKFLGYKNISVTIYPGKIYN